MLRVIQRLNYRDRVKGELDALLLMYPRKRQFDRDFPALKQTIRARFEAGVAPASAALEIATQIVEGFLSQLSPEQKQAVAAALVAGDLRDLEALAGRRIGGERDKKSDQVAFATRLSGMAMFMAGRMTSVGALSSAEYERLVAAVEAALGAEPGMIGRTFALPAALR